MLDPAPHPLCLALKLQTSCMRSSRLLACLLKPDVRRACGGTRASLVRTAARGRVNRAARGGGSGVRGGTRPRRAAPHSRVPRALSTHVHQSGRERRAAPDAASSSSSSALLHHHVPHSPSPHSRTRPPRPPAPPPRAQRTAAPRRSLHDFRAPRRPLAERARRPRPVLSLRE